LLVTAQDSELLNKIDKLKAEIALSENGKKLQFMDSLVKTINYNSSLKFDSIVKATVAFALQIDSLGIAANRTADLIYYNNSILNKPEEGIVIFNEFLNKNLPVKNSYSLARLYLNGADSYFFNNEYNKAIEIYEIAEKYAIKAKEDRLLGFVNLYIGQTRESLGMFVEASQNYNNAYNYFIKVKDTFNIISSKNSLAVLYSKNGFYEDAKRDRDEAMLLLHITKNYMQITNLYYNTAVDYSKLGIQDKRIDNLLKALEFSEKAEPINFIRPIILNTLVIAYAKNNNIDLAKEYLKEVESNLKENTKGQSNELYKEALLTIAFLDKDYKKAILIGNDLLNDKIKRREPIEIARIEKLVAEIYEKLGDSKNSLIHLKNHLILNDSIKSIQKVKNLVYYQTLYETDKKDFKIIEQGENIDVLNAKNKVKNQWIIFILISLIGLFAFILLLRSRNAASKIQKLQ
jgi:tetratricopeptide (TPR) repeat protein